MFSLYQLPQADDLSGTSTYPDNDLWAFSNFDIPLTPNFEDPIPNTASGAVDTEPVEGEPIEISPALQSSPILEGSERNFGQDILSQQVSCLMNQLVYHLSMLSNLF
jgi:hypothetical protein